MIFEGANNEGEEKLQVLRKINMSVYLTYWSTCDYILIDSSSLKTTISNMLGIFPLCIILYGVIMHGIRFSTSVITLEDESHSLYQCKCTPVHNLQQKH